MIGMQFMVAFFAIVLGFVGLVRDHISASPEFRRLAHLAYQERFSKLDRDNLASALEKDRVGFAVLHTELDHKVLKTDALSAAVRREARRRIASAAKGWSQDHRIDFLVEGAVASGTEDSDLTRKLGLLAIEVARPVAKKYSPGLLEPVDRSKRPLCETFGYLTLKDEVRVQTTFDDEAFTLSGKFYSGPLIGALPLLKCDDEFRASLLLTRDGIRSKTPRFPRRPLTFERSIVISNGSVELDDVQHSIVIADAPVRFSSGSPGNSCIVSNDSIYSQAQICGPVCTLIARNTIRSSLPTTTKGSTLIAGEVIDVPKPKNSETGTHIVGKDKYDPGVRFFAVGDVGLELKDVDGYAVVKSVAEGSPFRQSLKPGDRVNSINDKFFMDFDDCRRALRESCVAGYAFVNRTRDGHHSRVLVDLLGYPKPIRVK